MSALRLVEPLEESELDELHGIGGRFRHWRRMRRHWFTDDKPAWFPETTADKVRTLQLKVQGNAEAVGAVMQCLAEMCATAGVPVPGATEPSARRQHLRVVPTHGDGGAA